jgi:hypothetical protein
MKNLFLPGNTFSRKHGQWRKPIYAVWSMMLQRCNNPKHNRFHRYGGRGITVCERWRSFQNFFDDMGERPPGMSLDRRDNDKGYEPGNCRWATRKEQSKNQLKPRRNEFNGRFAAATSRSLSQMTAGDQSGHPASLSDRSLSE